VPALPFRAPAAVQLALSGDGKLLATSGDGEQVRLWEMPAARPRGVINTGQARIQELALSADGKRLLAAGSDGSLLVWDTAKTEPNPKPVVVDRKPAELEERWRNLGEFDFKKKYAAMWDLAESGP